MSPEPIRYYDEVLLKSYSADGCLTAIRILKDRIDQLTNMDYQSAISTEITDLPLSIRASNVLRNAGLHTVGETVAHGLERLYHLRNCGEATVKEITAAIDKRLALASQDWVILKLIVQIDEEKDLRGRIEGQGKFTPTGFGQTLDELIQNVKGSILDFQEHEGKRDKFWGKVDLERVGFKIKLEIN